MLLSGLTISGRMTANQISSAPTPLPNTLLLLRGNGTNNSVNNVFIDSSPNNFTMTTVGATFATLVQSSFTPFNTSFNDYTLAMGGSVYMDGNSHLTYSGTTFGTGQYTIEFWFRSDNFSTIRIPINTSATNGLNIRFNNSTSIAVNRRGGTEQVFTVPTMSTGVWYHLAIVRNASNQTTVFLNGTRSSTGAVTMAVDYSAATNGIGGIADQASNRFIGSLSNLRIVTGSSVYDPTSSSITVPTSPVGSIAGTQLLLNFNNFGVFDSTSRNMVGLDGNARISTTQSKYGGSSIFTDGVGDRLVIPTTGGALTQSGDFTYETWIYFNALPTTGFQNICGQGAAGQNTFGIFAGNTAANNWSPPQRFKVNKANIGDQIIGTTSIAINTWYHVALVRSSGSVRLYVNGTQEGSTVSDSGTYSFNNNPFTIGFNSNAYFDDFRISNIARYTSNFTPPGPF